ITRQGRENLCYTWLAASDHGSNTRHGNDARLDMGRYLSWESVAFAMRRSGVRSSYAPPFDESAISVWQNQPLFMAVWPVRRATHLSEPHPSVFRCAQARNRIPRDCRQTGFARSGKVRVWD